MKKGGFADSIERSSAKWKCASPQAQTDVNYTTPPAGEQERLERLEKKVGWFDPPKKLRRTALRSEQSSQQEEGVNQVSRKLNFNEESPQLSTYSLSPNTLISPFQRMKLSPESTNITRNNNNNTNNNYTQFSPSQQTTMTQQQGYDVASYQQQQQQYIPVPLQAQYGQQIQQRGNIYQQGEQQQQQSTQLTTQQQHRQNPINRSTFVVQPTTNNYRTNNNINNNNNNNNNILKFR